MKERFLLAMLAVVFVIAIMNTFFLHIATEKLKQREVDKEQIRLEVYEHLDSLAWSVDLNENRRYILSRDNIFRCEVLREEIKRYKEGYYAGIRK